MDNLEGVTDCVVRSLQGSEAREDLVVDALDEDDSFEWIVVLNQLVVLVPCGDCVFSV